MSWQAWLEARYAPSTSRSYARIIRQWLAAGGGVSAASAADYASLASWLATVQSRLPHPGGLRLYVHALRAFYAWLLASGVRADDPSRSLAVTGSRGGGIHLADLLVPSEIRQLRRHAGALPASSAVLLDLLSWSGLRGREIASLRRVDIDLASGSLFVAASGRSLPRRLVLGAVQHDRLAAYLPGLPPGEHLLLGGRGRPLSVDLIHHRITRLRPLLPGRRLTPTLIRQSVLAMMLAAGHDLRAVQLFAGHRHPGTTERYRFTGLEELKAAVSSFHPMG